jgi:hypothetical protein
MDLIDKRIAVEKYALPVAIEHELAAITPEIFISHFRAVAQAAGKDKTLNTPDEMVDVHKRLIALGTPLGEQLSSELNTLCKAANDDKGDIHALAVRTMHSQSHDLAMGIESKRIIAERLKDNPESDILPTIQTTLQLRYMHDVEQEIVDMRSHGIPDERLIFFRGEMMGVNQVRAEHTAKRTLEVMKDPNVLEAALQLPQVGKKIKISEGSEQDKASYGTLVPTPSWEKVCTQGNGFALGSSI